MYPDPASAATYPDLVIGIDGGGTHTVALLAERADDGPVIGRGEGVPEFWAAGVRKRLAPRLRRQPFRGPCRGWQGYVAALTALRIRNCYGSNRKMSPGVVKLVCKPAIAKSGDGLPDRLPIFAYE